MADADFIRGSVRRVKLHNFMTYTDVEFRPGPRLNIVIGANGTGKSTIVCALALGLAGDPKILGRSNKLRDYIRRGATDCFVEVELHEVEGAENAVVRLDLTIKPDNKIVKAFTLNGRPIRTEKLQEKLRKDYKTQVDNMCQFLPQDRVGEFSQFDEKMLFRETQRALLGQWAVDRHEELQNTQLEHRTAQHEIDTTEGELAKLEDELKALQGEVERVQQREGLLEEARLCRKKVPWQQFEDARQHTLKLMEASKQADAALEGLRKDNKPLERAVAKAKEEQAERQEEQSAASKNLKSARRNLVRAKEHLDKHDETLTGVLDELNGIEQERVLAKKSVAAAEQALAKYEDEYSKTKDEDTIAGLLEKHNARSDELAKELADIDAKLVPINFNVQKCKAERTLITKERAALSNRLVQQRKILDSTPNGADAKAILEALDAGGGSGSSSSSSSSSSSGPALKTAGRVLGPMVMCVQFTDDFHAQCLENAMRPALMSTFVTDNNDADRRLLAGLKIAGKSSSASVINVTRAGNPRHPFPKEFLDSIAVEGYLDDLIDADPRVKTALRDACNIDTVLVGTAETERLIERSDGLNRLRDAAKKANLQRVQLVTPSSEYDLRKARFGDHYLTDVKDFSARGRGQGGKRLLTGPKGGKARKSGSAGGSGSSNSTGANGGGLDADDEDEGERLERQLGEVDSKLAELYAEQEQLLKVKGATTTKQEQVTEYKSQLNKDKRARKALQDKVNTARAKLQAAKDTLHTNWAAKAAELQESIAEGNRKRVKAGATLAKVARELAKEQESSITLAIDVARAEAALEAAEQALLQRINSLEAAEQQAAEAKDLYKTSAQKLKHLKTKASETCALTDEIKEQFTKLPNTVALLEAQAEQKELQANAIFDDPDSLRRYKKAVVDIKDHQKNLDNLKAAQAQRLDDIKRLEGTWRKPVEEITSKLSKSVRRLFSEISAGGYKCAGDVELQAPEDDYSAWGVVIKVRFRDGSDMQRLDATVHSGGERSLSTFLYMLALQEAESQTTRPCPFRVVDEINQGMDEDKERLAFYRLVNSTCKPGKPQYFLVTPKLLSGVLVLLCCRYCCASSALPFVVVGPLLADTDTFPILSLSLSHTHTQAYTTRTA